MKMPWKLYFLLGILTVLDAKPSKKRMPVPKHPGFDVKGTDLRSLPSQKNVDYGESAWEQTDLLEGDLVVSQLRNAVGQPDKLWNSPIPVCISEEDFDDDDQETIEEALFEIKSKTCVTFRACHEQDTEFVYVRGNSTGCWSLVGKHDGGQVLHLQPDGCLTHGTIIHEFLHVLGFYHQHSDPDRDYYVTINWENIAPRKERNFRAYEKDHSYPFKVTYDYDSLMHYGRRSFSKNGKETITPKDEKAKIGQRLKLSEKDIAKINYLYKCDKDNHVRKESEDELDDLFDF